MNKEQPPKSFAEEWDAFCEQLCALLKAAGSEICETSQDEFDRDEGIRVLLRQLRHSTEREIEEWDVDHPTFAPVYTTTYHTLADAPDYASFDAAIDGTHEYLLTGRVGKATTVSFNTHAPRSANPDTGAGTMPELWSGGGSSLSDRQAGKEITGLLDLSECEVGADGSFSIILSASRPKHGVWLPMKLTTDRVVVRNMYHGSYLEHRRASPAELSIRRIGVDPVPGPYPTHALRSGMAAILAGVSRPVLGRGKIFNRIRALGPGNFSNDDTFWKMSGSNARTHFQEAYWEIGPDDALVIDIDPPADASFWSIGLTNAWMESLDFRYAPINLNSTSAAYASDGSVRIVVALRDPGIPNWLNTLGHRHGTLLIRWNDMDEKPPLPRTQLVRVDSLLPGHPPPR